MANPSLTKTFKAAYQEAVTSNSFNKSLDRMTVEGTAAKTIGLFSIVALIAAGFMFFNPAVDFGFILAAILVGLGLNLYITFSKTVKPILMVAYAALQGVTIGFISSMYEQQYPGIVTNAVFGTLAAAAGIFFAWRRGLIKVNSKAIKIFGYAMLGYLGFSLINIGFAVFTGGNVYSSPFAILASLVGVGLASYSIAVDLQIIQSGIDERLPKENEWRGAFGLVVTLVWLYIEILRLLGLASRK